MGTIIGERHSHAMVPPPARSEAPPQRLRHDGGWNNRPALSLSAMPGHYFHAATGTANALNGQLAAVQ